MVQYEVEGFVSLIDSKTRDSVLNRKAARLRYSIDLVYKNSNNIETLVFASEPEKNEWVTAIKDTQEDQKA